MKLVIAYALSASISSEHDENGALEISDASGSKTYLIVKCLSRSNLGTLSTAQQTPKIASERGFVNLGFIYGGVYMVIKKGGGGGIYGGVYMGFG